MTYKARAVTDAVIAALAAGGLRVGDGEKPADSGWLGVPGSSTFRAYVVVHPVGGSEIDGTLDLPSDDVWPLHQVTSYGSTRAGCEQVADNARAVMLAAPMAVAGRSRVRWLIDLVGVVTRADDVQPAIFMSPDRYTGFNSS